ncbi:MAG: SUMF1/EgtB/PvdO family nonheme iron enzyme [Planctomycetaceae bacterium]|nr:SUMF1/EgtB/PvdO family nonheme iron enzyme [Planctomycetaceae bacterium]
MAITGERVPNHEIFLSYSNKDKAVADAICVALEARHIRCWIAPRDIVPGATWADSIIGAIEEAQAMVLVYSANTNLSTQVIREVERAVAKGLLIIPFRIADSPMCKQLEYFLSASHWFDAMSGQVEEHLERFAPMVRSLLATERQKQDSATDNTAAAKGQVSGMPSWSRHKAGNVTAYAATVKRMLQRHYVLLTVLGMAIAMAVAMVAFRGGNGKNQQETSSSPAPASKPVSPVPQAIAEESGSPRATLVKCAKALDTGNKTDFLACLDQSGTSQECKRGMNILFDITIDHLGLKKAIKTKYRNGGDAAASDGLVLKETVLTWVAGNSQMAQISQDGDRASVVLPNNVRGELALVHRNGTWLIEWARSISSESLARLEKTAASFKLARQAVSEAATYQEYQKKFKEIAGQSVIETGSVSEKTQSPKALTKTNWQKRSSDMTLELGEGAAIKLILIPAGTFMTGGPGTQREKTINRPFYMGMFEVTQAQYRAITDTDPSYFRDPENAVERVSWDEAVEFCKKVSQKTGRTVRLPTEAEWEYACRAGTETSFCWGDDETIGPGYAWFLANSERKPHAVGQKKPNAWGLHDMHGNVNEWCSNRYAQPSTNADSPALRAPAANQTYCILRGGAWNRELQYCRSASRSRGFPDRRYSASGFRIAMDSPDIAPASSVPAIAYGPNSPEALLAKYTGAIEACDLDGFMVCLDPSNASKDIRREYGIVFDMMNTARELGKAIKTRYGAAAEPVFNYWLSQMEKDIASRAGSMRAAKITQDGDRAYATVADTVVALVRKKDRWLVVAGAGSPLKPEMLDQMEKSTIYFRLATKAINETATYQEWLKKLSEIRTKLKFDTMPAPGTKLHAAP